MSVSLIEELPKIVAEGKKEVERVLERLASPQKLTLQTNELVLPSKDVSGLFRGKVPDVGAGREFQLFEEQQKTLAGFEPHGQLPLGAKAKAEWLNRLVYGDNLLVMQALLAGDPATGLPPMRGIIDLIYIDPPFDSKADYRTKITLAAKQLSVTFPRACPSGSGFSRKLPKPRCASLPSVGGFFAFFEVRCRRLGRSAMITWAD